jgi:septal ring factor EnvC (AmiA/AmiB activator)
LIQFGKFCKIAIIPANRLGGKRSWLPPEAAPISGKQMKAIERQIRDLQRELSEVQKEQASLRLQPCQGDMEIRKKEENLENLEKRARSIREKIRELERKLQEKMAEILKKSGYESPSFWRLDKPEEGISPPGPSRRARY